MEETQGFFCNECGYQATENFGFCPRCGARYTRASVIDVTTSLNGNDSQPTSASPNQNTQDAYLNYAKSIQKQFLENGRTVTMIMLGVWVLMSMSLSVTLFLLPENIVSQVGDYTGLGKQLIFEGSVLMVSCALAVVSLVFIYLRKKWEIALYSCISSTFVTVLLLLVGDSTGIYFMLCGLLTSLRVRNLKPLFS